MVPITSLYAGMLAILYLLLSLRVIRARQIAGVALGDGNDADLAAIIRAHGNFAEYVPFGLVLMATAELGGAASLWLHAVGLVLSVGRLLHAMALLRQDLRLRVCGMGLTFSALILGALGCLWFAV